MTDHNKQREELYRKYENLIEVDFNLSRSLVSFQSSKQEPFYGWFKYREGFSPKLVEYFLLKYHPAQGHILDPFAGSGSALFAAGGLGWRSTGIEVLPVGKFVMESRVAAERVDIKIFECTIKSLIHSLDKSDSPSQQIRHIPITEGAFPKEAEDELNRYISLCHSIVDENVRTLFRFAAFCILEEISFTRKDGQFLRWDERTNRGRLRSQFNKGKIYSFKEAIERKLCQFNQDLQPSEPLELFPSERCRVKEVPEIILDSSLERLPRLTRDSFGFIMTSPPYCNRYDYTRTYALELVFLGYDDEEVKQLRQAMLSCTVENREKVEALRTIYAKLGRLPDYEKVLTVYETCGAVQEVNQVLEDLKGKKKLNNSNVPRMVRNYLLEMCFTIFEMERVLCPGGFVVMVNDNVRYGGEEVPIDLILSDFANRFGLTVRKIWVLPTGKGNSSQQMGNYGRTELRKCIYVWEK